MTPRPLRADARRNRDRLLEVAVDALAEDGPETSLEGIARTAGVGIGTLYRHFPTREALIEAAYRNELERVCSSAAELLATNPPDAALRAWMDNFVDYMVAKRGMSRALQAVIASGCDPFSNSRDMLYSAVGTLLAAGAKAGTVRDDVPAGDVVRAVSGITATAGEPEERDLAGRLLDLLMAGLLVKPST